ARTGAGQCAGRLRGAGRHRPGTGRIRQVAAGCDGQMAGRDHGARGRIGDLAPAGVADARGAGDRIAGIPVGTEFPEARRTQLRVERVNAENTSPAPESGGSTEYINHHVHHLQVRAGDGAFMTLNVDTLFFTLVLSVLFLATFLLTARRATAGVPGKFQAFVEIIVGFVDGLVRETFHGRSKLIAPLSITIFLLVFLMNFMDMVPVDFLPWAWASGHAAAGHDPAHAYLRVVPTADLNTTFGLSIAVFLLIQVFGIGHKGVGGFTK